jgi:tRNA (Thr-GGU) A37 N-methylase/monoamine oxidase
METMAARFGEPTASMSKATLDANSTKSATDELDCDVVVVGAGVSGLQAAFDLAKKGYDCILLEASDYVGGRIKTARLGDKTYNVGARFIHGKENNVLFDLYEKNGWGSHDMPTDYPSHLYDPDNLGNTSLIIDEAKKRDVGVDHMFQLFDMMTTEELHDRKDATMAEFLTSNGLGEALLPLATAIWASDRGSSVESAGIFECQMAERGWQYGDTDSMPDSSTFQPLIDHLSEPLRGKIRLNCVVTRIDSSSSDDDRRRNGCDTVAVEYVITGSDNISRGSDMLQTLVARAVIVSVPLPVLQRGIIRFTPPLSVERQEALARLQAFPILGIILRFRERPWPKHMNNAQIACGGTCPVPDFTLKESKNESNKPICTATCFIVEKKAEYFRSLLTDEARVKVALDQLDAMFPKTSAKASDQASNILPSSVYMDSYQKDWGEHPYVWCGYSSPSPRAWMGRFNGESKWAREIIAAPHGPDDRVLFCGEATYMNVDSTIQSAMTTGVRAFREACAALERLPVGNGVSQGNSRSTVEAFPPAPSIQETFTFSYQSIGRVRSIFPECRGTPRQGHLMPSARACLVLHADISEDVLVGLEEYEYVWVIFHFHKNKPTKKSNQQAMLDKKRAAANLPPSRPKFKAKVRPPKMDGPLDRVGVFACRTPHRPNPLGLSVAKILKVCKHEKVVWLGGLDLVDETPVMDIKPYVATYDAQPAAAMPIWVKNSLSHVCQPVYIDDSVRLKISLAMKDNPGLFLHFMNVDEVCTGITEMLALDITSGATKKAFGGSKRTEGWNFCVSLESMNVVCEQWTGEVRVVDCHFVEHE